MGFAPFFKVLTIASGASLSSASVDLTKTGGRFVGIEMPASWDTANLTFSASLDDSTFNDVYDAQGYEYIVYVDAARFIGVAPSDFAGMRYLKVRSGTTGAPVLQTSDRDIRLVFDADQ
jgi:hypothetical protein